MRISIARWMLAGLVMQAVACGDDGAPDAADGGADALAAAFHHEGTVTGSPLPTSAKTGVFWIPSKASAIKFGDGTAAGDSYEITIATDPPASAQVDGAAIAVIVLLDEAFDVADGTVVTEEEIAPHVLGDNDDYQLIWRSYGPAPDPSLEPFPIGFSCGYDPEGEGVTPVDCDAYTMQIAPVDGSR
jgi:hypothetical protein